MIKLRVTKKRDGQTVFWMRDAMGRQVRIGNPNRMNWIRAQQLRELGEYGLGLILERTTKGIGSDDAPMKPLTEKYGRWKRKIGLGGERNLRGPGKGGHHLMDDPRITHFDDRRVEFGISTRQGRIKARANEDRSPWWGWSPSDMKKMVAKFQEIFEIGIVEAMVSRGLAGITMATGTLASTRRWFRRAA
ncbi:MAG: hypothetical protein ABFD89_16950 [Bryobacteraceae bacterium]